MAGGRSAGPGAFAGGVSRWVTGAGRRLITVLSVDGQGIRLLEARRSGRTWQVETAVALATQGRSAEQVVDELAQACRDAGCDPESVIVANPSHLTTTRFFTLPSSNPREIRDIIQLQSEKHTPYAKDEILTDFSIVHSEPSGYSRVMLIISHQDVVHRALRIVNAMGWALESVGFELEGLMQWARALPEADGSSGLMLVADIQEETTTLVILGPNGNVSFHRTVTLGAGELRGGGEAAARLTVEFRRSLETFDAEGGAPVGQIILTGAADRVPEVSAHLAQHLERPVRAVAPFRDYAVSDQASGGAAETSVSFAGLLGMALAPTEVDLTPPALKLHRGFEIRARALVELGAQVLLGLLLVSGLMFGKMHRSERYLETLREAHARTAPQAGALELTFRQLELIDHWLLSRGRLLEGVAVLAQLCPASLRWSALTFSQGQDVIVRGTSNDMPEVFEYVAAIQRAALCSSVEARRVTKRREGEQYLTEFEIVCAFPQEEEPAA
ncbi:MAG TPA: pilus assembly protein PilM [bacterium]